MRNGKWIKTTKDEYIEESITCDVCQKIYNEDDDCFETQEFIHISQDCGYNSIFGDNSHIQIDICQHCFNDLLGDKIRVIKPRGLSDKMRNVLERIKRIGKENESSSN